MLDISIEKNIRKKYNLIINDFAQYKNGHIINTNEGAKILKSCRFGPGTILFVHGAKEHLYINGFKNIDRYLCTADGRPYLEINDRHYVVTNMMEGEESNFDRNEDVVKASRALAFMHKASKGYVPDYSCKKRDELGMVPVYFVKRLEEIKKQKKLAIKTKTNFDYLYLKHVDYFYDMGKTVIDAIKDSCYNKIVNICRQNGGFCHHDYTHRNIILGNNKVSVVNFEYCCHELKIYDIVNLLRRKMRKCKWSLDQAMRIIGEYQEIEDINQDEFSIMKLMLQFPQKFWRIGNRYYNGKRSWMGNSLLLNLQEVVDEMEYHSEFMKNFDMLSR